ISETVRRYFSRIVRFRQPAELVQNGVDTACFYPTSRGERGKPTFLFVGRFVEKKGLPILRELAQRLPQVQWRFAGWGALDPARRDPAGRASDARSAAAARCRLRARALVVGALHRSLRGVAPRVR